MRALRVGITGKIASGKSTFSAVLREHGVEVLDTDAIAKEVMTSDASLRSAITDLLGPQAYDAGSLNKAYVASQIFSDPTKRQELEAMVHPAVMRMIEERFASAPAGSIVAVESAIFVQTGYDEMFDVLVMVWASDESVIERGVNSGKFAREDVEQRLNEQDYSDEIKGFADFVIENNSTLEALRAKSEVIVSIIKAMALGELPDEPLRSIEPEEE